MIIWPQKYLTVGNFMGKSSTEILLILYLFRLYFLQIVEDIRCFCVQSSSFSVSLEIFVNKTLKVFSFL